MKRTLLFHLLFAFAACALSAPVASATTRCSDDPESCVKGASKGSRAAVQLATTSPSIAAPAQVAPASIARKSAPAAKKPAAKPQRVAPLTPLTPSPTPGMGVLLKLSNGATGEISWTPGKTSETPGQSWVL